jgi:UDP-glucose 4-epimerase
MVDGQCSKGEKMKILVTGGAGFMGSWLVDELLNRGHKVISVDDLSGGFMRNVNKKCKFVKMDLRDTKKVFRVTKGVDIIFHLAAYAAEGQSVFSPIEINDINIKPMNNLLVGAVNNGVKKFIFTSSMAVYGDQKPPFNEKMDRKPEDPYGCGKAYCERILEIFSETYGFDYTIIRPHNVYGPRQNISDPYRNVLGIWINRIMRNKPPFIYGDGKQTRAFSYIEDVTGPLANAGFYKKANGRIINLGSDEVVTINKACKIVLSAMKSKLKPKHVEARPCEVKHAHCTVGRSKKILGYRTKHKLKQGIEKMGEWATDFGSQKPTYRLPLEITKRAPKVWRDKLI